MPKLPSNLQAWPDDAEHLAIDEVVKLYENGFAGAYHDPEAKEQLLASLASFGMVTSGESIAHAAGFSGAGAGKLSLPYRAAEKQWPKCWPSPPQTTGSCVSKAGKNNAIILIGVEVETAQPDPVTGVVEGFPEVSEEAERNGVVASEPIYGDRGHSGQGASCSRLQNYVTTKGGILIRKNYPELGIDLTVANDNIGARWGGSGTPSNISAEGKKHQIRTAAECENHEVARDFLAAGYPLWVCSGYGWSSKRDENGYSKRSGSWSHSWTIGAYDDREETKQKYGFPLALYFHDWGKWNSGGRRILGTDIDIPEGCMWIDARLLDNCEVTAMSNMNGWPNRAPKLVDWKFW